MTLEERLQNVKHEHERLTAKRTNLQAELEAVQNGLAQLVGSFNLLNELITAETEKKNGDEGHK